MSLSAESLVCALAGVQILGEAGWPEVHERARTLAALLAERLRERGREVAPRGETTLVSFESHDPPAERALLAERGVILRNIPGVPGFAPLSVPGMTRATSKRLLDGLAAKAPPSCTRTHA